MGRLNALVANVFTLSYHFNWIMLRRTSFTEKHPFHKRHKKESCRNLFLFFGGGWEFLYSAVLLQTNLYPIFDHMMAKTYNKLFGLPVHNAPIILRTNEKNRRHRRAWPEPKQGERIVATNSGSFEPQNKNMELVIIVPIALLRHKR